MTVDTNIVIDELTDLKNDTRVMEDFDIYRIDTDYSKKDTIYTYGLGDFYYFNERTRVLSVVPKNKTDMLITNSITEILLNVTDKKSVKALTLGEEVEVKMVCEDGYVFSKEVNVCNMLNMIKNSQVVKEGDYLVIKGDFRIYLLGKKVIVINKTDEKTVYLFDNAFTNITYRLKDLAEKLQPTEDKEYVQYGAIYYNSRKRSMLQYLGIYNIDGKDKNVYLNIQRVVRNNLNYYSRELASIKYRLNEYISSEEFKNLYGDIPKEIKNYVMLLSYCLINTYYYGDNSINAMNTLYKTNASTKAPKGYIKLTSKRIEDENSTLNLVNKEVSTSTELIEFKTTVTNLTRGLDGDGDEDVTRIDIFEYLNKENVDIMSIVQYLLKSYVATACNFYGRLDETIIANYNRTDVKWNESVYELSKLKLDVFKKENNNFISTTLHAINNDLVVISQESYDVVGSMLDLLLESMDIKLLPKLDESVQRYINDFIDSKVAKKIVINSTVDLIKNLSKTLNK